MTGKDKVSQPLAWDDLDEKLNAKAAVDPELADLREENARLREALEPFAKELDRRAQLAPGPDIDHWPIGMSALTLGDLRRAHAALAALPRTEDQQ